MIAAGFLQPCVMFKGDRRRRGRSTEVRKPFLKWNREGGRSLSSSLCGRLMSTASALRQPLRVWLQKSGDLATSRGDQLLAEPASVSRLDEWEFQRVSCLAPLVGDVLPLLHPHSTRPTIQVDHNHTAVFDLLLNRTCKTGVLPNPIHRGRCGAEITT